MPNVYVPIAQKDDEERDEKFEALQAQLEAVRAEAEAARESAAQEREERRLEQERAQATQRESELKREIDAIRSEQARRDDENRRQFEAIQQQHQSQLQQLQATLQNNKGGMADRLIEMQMASIAQQQQRAEQERMEREQRAREDQIRRTEESTRREREWKRDQESQQQRTDELRKLEEARRVEERRLSEDNRKDAQAQQNRLLEVMLGQKQKPEEMLMMLEKMVKLRPEKDTFEEIQKLAGVAMMVKDLVGGQPEQENKWETIVRSAGEAVGKAVGDIQARRAEQPQGPVPQPYQQYLPAPQGQPQGQPQGLPQGQHPSLPAPHPQQGNPIMAEPTGPEWGRILGFAVESYEAGNDPEVTATHLHTMVMVGMQRPRALEKLEGADSAQLKFQLNLLQMDQRLAQTEYLAKVRQLIQILDHEEGAAWVDELLDYLTSIQRSLREAAQQEMAAQQQAQAQAQGQGQPYPQQPYPQQGYPHQQPQQQPQQQQQPTQPTQGPVMPAADMTPEEFAAQARGAQPESEAVGGEELSAEAFSAQARGDEGPAPDPTGGWGEPQ